MVFPEGSEYHMTDMPLNGILHQLGALVCFHIDFHLGINPKPFLLIMLCLFASFHWPTVHMHMSLPRGFPFRVLSRNEIWNGKSGCEIVAAGVARK